MPSPKELVYFSWQMQKCLYVYNDAEELSDSSSRCRRPFQEPVFSQKNSLTLFFVQRAAGLPSHPDIEKAPP